MQFFSAGMKSMMAGLLGESPLAPYVHVFDWASLGAGTVVDIGRGPTGHVEAGLPPQIPRVVKLVVVVQDLPASAVPASPRARRHSTRAHDRVAFRPHDSFPPLSPRPSAARSRSRKIPRPQRLPAQPRTARLARRGRGSVERVLPARGEQVLRHTGEQTRAQDSLMFTLFGGARREHALGLEGRACEDEQGAASECFYGQPLGSVFSFNEVVPGAAAVSCSPQRLLRVLIKLSM